MSVSGRLMRRGSAGLCPLEVDWRHVAQRRVDALLVVEQLDVVEHRIARFVVPAEVRPSCTSSVLSVWLKLSIAALWQQSLWRHMLATM